MHFDLDPSEIALQDETRALTREVARFAAEADASNGVHGVMRRALQRSGLSALMVPAEFGGRNPQVDPLAVCVVREVLMGTSSHLDSLFALQGIGSYAITRGGTAEQRRHWLPQVARLDVLAALALTEPDAGSDLKRIRTSLTDTGDRLILNGHKSFISNAGAAGYYLVLAKEGAGLSLVLVPADTPGLRTQPCPEIMAPHVLGDVYLDGVELPSSSRLGAPGAGLDLVLETLAVFRVSVAAAAVGLADAALREATRHASAREQFGRPLARIGPVAQLLADSWADVEMARLLTYRAATAARVDPRAALNDSSMAKVAASEAASRVVDRCVQVMGRWGLIHGSIVERAYRQARPMRIYEGASEVLKLGLAKTLCAEVAATAVPQAV